MIRLGPSQIGANWSDIFKTIRKGNPFYDKFADAAESRLVQAFADQRLQYWPLFSKPSNPEEIEVVIGGLTTNFSTDMFYGIKRLWIYSISIAPEWVLNKQGWKSIFSTLEKYAEQNSCHELVGFVHDPRLAKSYERYLGFEVQSFVIKEINHG